MARPGSHRLFVSARVGVAAAGLALVQPCLGPALPLAAVEMTSRQPQMRVLVAEGARLDLRADGSNRFQVRGLGRRAQQLTRLQVRLSGGRLLVDSPDLSGARQVRVKGLTVHSQDPRGIWLGKRRYAGSLELMVRNGRLQAVNHLGVETYLASVVGSEMPQDWPLAALQAQAVAARTYALRQRGRKGSFDVQATVASQVYRGLESATPRTQEAVDTTRSLVMVHGGKLINAVFHSSSGGATEPSGEVWRTQLPYLVSVPDHDAQSPVHRWTQTFDRRQLQAAFRETDGLQAVDVLRTSSTGRLRSVRVRGPGGSVVLSGRELRQRLGLKSTMVRFNWLAQEVAGQHSRPVRQGGLPEGDRPLLIGLWRDSASGSSTSPQSHGRTQALILPPPPPPPLVPAPGLRAPQSGRVLEVRGQGFGHGVGMSQWGARGLAEQGADFRQILRHYYRGITIRPFQPADDPSMAFHPALRPAWNS